MGPEKATLTDVVECLCSAAHYGQACAGQQRCPARRGVRIPLSLERRVFTPLVRSSYAWERAYQRRTTVERVNSRLDASFGSERHLIRGLKKIACVVA